MGLVGEMNQIVLVSGEVDGMSETKRQNYCSDYEEHEISDAALELDVDLDHVARKLIKVATRSHGSNGDYLAPLSPVRCHSRLYQNSEDSDDWPAEAVGAGGDVGGNAAH